ncbi:hypothetical protein A7E78_08120 [Syntrophotalea acetylenivorans]|uniref:DUF211 domain-containing protein n=1 Tax=Syntrophotalea acetylenivorans TaxID=1842532 RepID=A0A1L3GPE5_9BACT|nr:DUF211 domain-containing protein [Syntrophotalea acetylenivorans]APG27807.1 hypothetical protein A7E78_08120 [Syntrophotalea acetylenivorans]
MLLIKRIVLDVLKPHHPNSIDFTLSIAEKSPGSRVELTVTEVDEKTETVVIVIVGENLHYDTIADAVSSMGGSIHSIDKVEVENEPD